MNLVMNLVFLFRVFRRVQLLKVSSCYKYLSTRRTGEVPESGLGLGSNNLAEVEVGVQAQESPTKKARKVRADKGRARHVNRLVCDAVLETRLANKELDLVFVEIDGQLKVRQYSSFGEAEEAAKLLCRAQGYSCQKMSGIANLKADLKFCCSEPKKCIFEASFGKDVFGNIHCLKYVKHNGGKFLIKFVNV